MQLCRGNDGMPRNYSKHSHSQGGKNLKFVALGGIQYSGRESKSSLVVLLTSTQRSQYRHVRGELRRNAPAPLSRFFNPMPDPNCKLKGDMGFSLISDAHCPSYESLAQTQAAYPLHTKHVISMDLLSLRAFCKYPSRYKSLQKFDSS